jgi:hypothetical protein
VTPPASFETELVRNAALGAELLWNAVQTFGAVAESADAYPLEAAFLVLPIALHAPSARAVNARNRPNPLIRAVTDAPVAFATLQTRMERMSGRTWESLRVGLATRLLLMDPGSLGLRIGVRRLRVAHTENVSRVAISAARKVGVSLRESSLEAVVAALGVRF